MCALPSVCLKGREVLEPAVREPRGWGRPAASSRLPPVPVLGGPPHPYATSICMAPPDSRCFFYRFCCALTLELHDLLYPLP